MGGAKRLTVARFRPISDGFLVASFRPISDEQKLSRSGAGEKRIAPLLIEIFSCCKNYLVGLG